MRKATRDGDYAQKPSGKVNEFREEFIGILVDSTIAPVTDNTIVGTGYGAGISFNCFGSNNVQSNTILNSAIGLYQVPTSVVTTDTYHNVGTIRTGGC